MLKCYLNGNNDGVAATNDKYEIDQETNKVAEIKSVEVFDIRSKPLFGISTECEEPEKPLQMNYLYLKYKC